MANRKRKKLTAAQREKKNKAARDRRAKVTRPATPPAANAAGSGETHVRLKIGRCGTGIVQNPGEIIKVSTDEAATLIKAEKAVAVTQQEAETAMAAGQHETR